MNYLNSPSGRIAYIKAGAGQPIVLVHGLGSSVLDWQQQIDYLSQFYQVYALDLPGHGLSDKLKGPIQMSDFADDVANFIAAMDIQPCFVIGISMGGMITLQLLTQSPELVHAAAIINSAPNFDSLKIRLIIMLRIILLRVFGPKLLARTVANNLFTPSQKEYREIASQRIAATDRNSYILSLKAIFGWSVLDALKTVDKKLLVITGDRDYTPVSYKQEYVAKLNNAHLEIVRDSGHATPIDQPGRLNTLLHEFIASNLPAVAQSS